MRHGQLREHFNQQNTFMIAVMLGATAFVALPMDSGLLRRSSGSSGCLSSLLLRSSKDEPQFTATRIGPF